MLTWIDKKGLEQQAEYLSERGQRPFNQIECVDDATRSETASRLATQGVCLIWQGDFQNARQLINAMKRRTLKAWQGSRSQQKKWASLDSKGKFYAHRQSQLQLAGILNQVLVLVEPGFEIAASRAPNCVEAFEQVWPEWKDKRFLIPLREVLGLIGALQWRLKGVPIPELEGFGDARIYPHYGVFSPVRGEYLALIAQSAMPPGVMDDRPVFDIGTGTGVIAILMAAKGANKVVATEFSDRALACASENFERYGLNNHIDLQKVNLFPQGKAALVVCNPPWLPVKPTSTIEQAVYDEKGQMLSGFLEGLADHLLPEGEGWLILSDLAEHLELRTREGLLEQIAKAGLKVLEKRDTAPVHGKAADENDPLYFARSKEVTSLWRLGLNR